MSKYYNLNKPLPSGKQWHQEPVFGRARQHQSYELLKNQFDETVLFYLDEAIIDHLLDSITLSSNVSKLGSNFNDFTFLTAPGYKALEGFLFQIAKDLKLPSTGNIAAIGSYYFDEKKIDNHIDKLIKELEKSLENKIGLSKYEKIDIKERIKELKSFLRHYRHSPAHFYGERVDTTYKADMNVKVIYSVIQNTTKILLKANLIKITDQLH